MIRLENIHIHFNKGTILECHALKGISANIQTGTFVTLIGSNGAGKSTLLNAIAGDIFVSQGHIFVDDKNITKYPPHKRAKNIARVFQDPMMGTCSELSIAENLSLAFARGKRHGLNLALNKSRTQLFQEKLRALNLGLETRLDEPMKSLSGGQRQCISLVMATLQPMSVLLLDEHTAALDPKTAAFVLELTQNIVETLNLTVIMVTHSMRQALDYGTRLLMLHEGRIVIDLDQTQKQNMDVQDLINLFSKTHHALDDDSLLL